VRPYRSALNGSPRFGRIPSTAHDEDVFGVSLDGSLRHFSLVTPDLWRVLNLVQTRAMTDEFSSTFDPSYQRPRRRYPVPQDTERERRMLSILDGDLLQRVLEQRGLETLLGDARTLASFKGFLDKLEDGKLTAPFAREDGDRGDCGEGAEGDAEYFALCYEILGYLLDAVI
jgi:hypothetical protein